MEPQTPPPPTTSEYEREPVPEKALKGPGSFWGMYAGEHTAGTEFMIGPLFVAWGVSAFDLLVGLLVGNLLAVLSWRYLCAPIATAKRMTLYFQLEKIAGPGLVKVYNLANGVLFCILAGAMITVSATAVGIFFNVQMPGLSDLYPTGIAWVLVVIAIGLVVAIVAAFGYDSVAKLANLAAPWMILIFIGCGLVTLPKLDSTALNDIWTGVPVEGQRKIGLWGVIFFSWLANAAMHIGMSDLSILRFAKKPSYGWASAAGMFLGHYIAWVAASLLFALALQRYGQGASNAPGPMVNDALGFAGLVCVVIAGWTTANPTIYRAGLAFQGIFPKSKRFTMTLMAGLLATVAGMFPAFAMKLLDFVGIYGTILAPIGAIIFFDFYVTKRMGLSPDYAEKTGSAFNLAVLWAWLLPIMGAAYIWTTTDVFTAFTAFPAWLACGVLFLVFSTFFQKGKHLALPICIVGWAGSILAPILFSLGVIADPAMKILLLASTLVWFMAVPVWMEGKH